MSIQHSEASCDWCKRKIGDGEDAACGACMTDAESENSDLKDTIKELEAKIDDLESRLP